jgi:small subunit ribosomal protein S1
MDKGAVITLEHGIEGFATPKHLTKEDGSQAKAGETLQFKVIEFNKETKRIILSHSRIFEDAQKAAEVAEAPKKAAKKVAKKEEVAAPSVEKTTLGDIESLAALKESLEAAEKKSKK